MTLLAALCILFVLSLNFFAGGKGSTEFRLKDFQLYWWAFHWKNRVGALIAALFGLEAYYLCVKRVSTGAFCDYCSCKDCQTGDSSLKLTRYACRDGTHICNVCFAIEPCVTTVAWYKRNRGSWFCQDHPRCRHKPVIIETNDQASSQP